ncbi:unnamed protein product, partial [Staurois parvus]
LPLLRAFLSPCSQRQFRSSGRTVRGEEFVSCPAYILTANVCHAPRAGLKGLPGRSLPIAGLAAES